ncbi:VWFA domain-containing protein [Aphelenchoides fujianensis]|nr:VWFA domain-containing protein [Aphelenchoides fujianensis]
MRAMNTWILLLSSFFVLRASACSDFVVLLNGGSTARSAEATRDLAASLSNQFELDAGIHRVALITGTDEEEETIYFDRIKTQSEYLEAVHEWEPSALSSSSKGLEARLERAVRLAAAHRRMNTALVVILLDDEGASAFNTNPEKFGLFADFVRKRHYVYVLIVSKKAERIRTSLAFKENEVETGGNRDELRLIASPFTRCQIRSANELRRKPLPRLSPNVSAQAAVSDEEKASTVVNLRPVTVPVSVRFPSTATRRPKSTTTRPTTPSSPPTTPTTTAKPKKTGCQFDVVVLFDLSSNSAGNLKRYQELTSDLIRQSEVGENAARFALIRYSGPKRTESLFHLNKHSNQSSLLKDVENVQPMGGTTRTAEAMRFALREFERKFGGRERNEVQRQMLVFTDGHSQDDPTEVAEELNRERVHVFAIGIEDPNFPPDLEQLRLIASDSKSALLDAQFGKVIEQLAPKRCRF